MCCLLGTIGNEGAVESPPESLAYEQLVEVVTCAVTKVNLDRPAEKQDICPSNKLDDHFLRAITQPPRQGLTFFPDLHTDVSRSWKHLIRPGSSAVIPLPTLTS